jgi:2-methylaconitate cis-trans-isomerase PrpF
MDRSFAVDTSVDLRCTIMRGGTSKGLILRRDDLPSDERRRDSLILSIFGSPDRRQIDGLGGADPLTSKVAIVGPPTRASADIDYTFGQVLVDKPHIDYGGYCGNILAAVAAYAVDEGFVPGSEHCSRVRVHVTNTGRIVIANVPVSNGRVLERGDLAIAGVPGTGAPIEIDFADTVGSTTGRLLPTGNPTDAFSVGGRQVSVSIVDAGNPMLFFCLDDFTISAAESPPELEQRKELMAQLDHVRVEAALELGITQPDGSASDHIPLVALVGGPTDYLAHGGSGPLSIGMMDLVSRELLCGGVHKAYGVGETVCTAAAALIPGTVVSRAAGDLPFGNRTVRIGHPSGVIEADVEVTGSGCDPEFQRISIRRTARRIMDGVVRAHER